MKKLQIVIIIALLSAAGYVSAAHFEGVTYRRIDTDQLFNENTPTDTRHTRTDTRQLSNQSLHHEQVPKRSGNVDLAPRYLYRFDESSALKKMPLDYSALQEVRLPDYKVVPLELGDSIKKVEDQNAKKREIRKKLDQILSESYQMDSNGYRYLDTSLNKKLLTLQKKVNSFEAKLKSLLKIEDPSLKQLKQIEGLIKKIEKVQNEMKKAVNVVQEKLSNDKKWKLLSKDEALINRVIRSGNRQAMQYFERFSYNQDDEAVRFTPAQLDIALKNHDYDMFDTLREINKKNGYNVEPSPEVVSQVLEVAIRNADAAGFAQALKVAGNQADGQKAVELQQTVENQRQAVNKEIETLKSQGNHITKAFDGKENNESYQARLEIDKQIINGLKIRLKALKEIKTAIENHVSDLRAVKVSNEVIDGKTKPFSFYDLPQSLVEGLNRGQVENFKQKYTNALESKLKELKNTKKDAPVSLMIERINKALAESTVDPGNLL